MYVSLILGSALFFFFFIYSYNQGVRNTNLVTEAWSGIDVQLKMRSNLLPQLVSCVKAYRDFEQSILTQVTELRSKINSETSVAERESLENALSEGLGRILMLAEHYPELKAGQNFQQLQKELVEIEDQIQYARRYYNGTVRNHNIFVQSFPFNLIARPLGFKNKDFFEIVSLVERKHVEIQM